MFHSLAAVSVLSVVWHKMEWGGEEGWVLNGHKPPHAASYKWPAPHHPRITTSFAPFSYPWLIDFRSMINWWCPIIIVSCVRICHCCVNIFSLCVAFRVHFGIYYVCVCIIYGWTQGTGGVPSGQGVCVCGEGTESTKVWWQHVHFSRVDQHTKQLVLECVVNDRPIHSWLALWLRTTWMS